MRSAVQIVGVSEKDPISNFSKFEWHCTPAPAANILPPKSPRLSSKRRFHDASQYTFHPCFEGRNVAPLHLPIHPNPIRHGRHRVHRHFWNQWVFRPDHIRSTHPPIVKISLTELHANVDRTCLQRALWIDQIESAQAARSTEQKQFPCSVQIE